MNTCTLITNLGFDDKGKLLSSITNSLIGKGFIGNDMGFSFDPETSDALQKAEDSFVEQQMSLIRQGFDVDTGGCLYFN